MTNKNSYWVSVADLMSGLMIVFMFIAIAYMFEMKQVINAVIYITEGFQDTEHSLYQELNKEFKEDLEEWNAVIDSKSLSIIFKEPDVLFQKGRYEIRARFKNILKDFSQDIPWFSIMKNSGPRLSLFESRGTLQANGARGQVSVNRTLTICPFPNLEHQRYCNMFLEQV